MRSARLLLACAAVSVLAACGTDPITAPVAPQGPRFDTGTTAPSDTSHTSGLPGSSECSGSLMLVTQSDGSVTLECVQAEKQNGTGS
ncbi:MAG TPA: hypothetical protein VF746_09350 [Longimicrobium sp.]|jgi:hypothetical protein